MNRSEKVAVPQRPVVLGAVIAERVIDLENFIWFDEEGELVLGVYDQMTFDCLIESYVTRLQPGKRYRVMVMEEPSSDAYC